MTEGDAREKTPPREGIELSVVVPVFNEEAGLDALATRLLASLTGLGLAFEVIFVDDGSRDRSLAVLARLCAVEPRFGAISFSRNFGKEIAISAGLDAARGRAVVIMDADLQHPPELIESFLERWREGYEMVYAQRRDRRGESAVRRWLSAGFYRLFALVSQTDLPPGAGDFRLLDRRVVDALNAIEERTRFTKGLYSWVGFRQIGVPYERDARAAGDPKYTLRKLVRLALSGYVGFSAMPLRISVWLGLLSAGVGFALGLGALATKFLGIYSPQGWVSTIVVILLVGGVQLLMLGVIGEYLARVYDEVRRRPLYVVRSRRGLGEPRDRDQADADR